MSKEFMKVYHMPFKAQEIKDDNFTNFRLQFDQAFEEMTKSFSEQQDEIIINYLYEKYKDTKVSDVWVLSKPDFEKFLLEMLPKWKGNSFKGSKEVKIEIPESSLMDYNPVKNYLKWEDLEKFKDKDSVKVKMNDIELSLIIQIDCLNDIYVQLYKEKEDGNCVNLLSDFFRNKELFNNLRLELLE